MRRINFPKRIRLGLPQKPHGRGLSRFHRLPSYQREWLEAKRAGLYAASLEAHAARIAELRRRPVEGFAGLLERQMEIAEASMKWNLEFALFGPDVDLSEMPRSPP